MIGIAIIISRGLLKTGLGMRIGYLLISLFGKRTLGVGYSLALADLVIGPADYAFHRPEFRFRPRKRH
ncbi:Inner membrane protein ybhI [Mycobacteroides abscessus subsp. massiliense]|nr:Inner membrane protein ybhI [Mycobacteroides abscessus subsp. massiliense]